MSETLTTMSLKGLFKFPFQEEGWESRFLVGTVLILAGYVIPIVPLLFVGGYILRVMRQAVRGEELALPAWEDWGELFVDGLGVFVINFVYLLPGMIVYFGGMTVYFFSNFYYPIAASTAADPEEAALAAMTAVFGGMAIMFICMFVGMVLGVVAAVALPPATAHFAAEGRVGAAFQLGQWWHIMWANKLGYFVAWTVAAGLMAMIYLVFTLAYFTCVLCCLLPILMAPFTLYLGLVGAALFGQVYRESVTMVPAPELVAQE